jgi:formyl-CoA transferase
VSSRWQHRVELDKQLGQWTVGHDNDSLTRLLQAHGVPAGAVLTARDLVLNPHLRERGYFEVFTNEHSPHVGPRLYAGRPFRLPNIPEALTLVSALGQHNCQILREVAGLSDEEIRRLCETGIIATRPHDTGKPAAIAPRTAEQRPGTQFDPEYRKHLRDFNSSSPAIPGGHD